MKFFAFLIFASSVAFAQTPAAKPTSPRSTSVTAKSATTTSAKPIGDMPVLHGIVKPLFVERYEDVKIGTGALAEPNKMYHVQYSGYLATTGQKFDSSFDHRVPVMKEGKPVMGADGKPELGDAQPLVFPQGVGRLIPGFDQGFVGMHVGGKRRVFIPWQLAYGTREIPAREGHPGIPAKSDLVFDVELVDVTDMPAAPIQPLGGGTTPRPVTPTVPAGQPAAPAAGTAPSAAPAPSSTPPK